MAIVASTLLGSFVFGTPGASQVTASISPTPGRLQLGFFCSNTGNSFAPTTVTGAGLTWVQVLVANAGNGTPTERCGLYRAMGAGATPGALTVNWAGSINGMYFHVCEVAGIDTGGVNGSAALVRAVAGAIQAGNNNPSMNMGGSFSSPNNGTIGFMYDDGAPGAITAGSGFTKLSSGVNEASCEWAPDNQSTVGFGDAGAFPVTTIVGIEIKVPDISAILMGQAML